MTEMAGGVRNMRRSASSSGRLDGRLSTSTTAERSGGPTKWGVSTSEVGEGIDMRVAVAARVVAAGRVAKSGEQLSTVQLLRGVVMARVVSGSSIGRATLSSTTTERVVMASMVNSE